MPQTPHVEEILAGGLTYLCLASLAFLAVVGSITITKRAFHASS